MSNENFSPTLTLVTGATGKTGRRVAAALRDRGLAVRLGSRSADIPFDWNDRSTWSPALNGVDAVYLAFQPDLAVPGAPDIIRAFTEAAKQAGVRRIVLLSGRGEPEAKECETIVREAGLDWTVVRCAWFAQNFTEGNFLDYILAGEVALPAGDIPEPFVDVDDIADVAVAALTTNNHRGELYELTGPRALSFAEATAEIAAATGRRITYVSIPHADFVAGLTEYQVPADVIALLDYLFGTVLDGRSSSPMDGVQRALGREPREFSDFVKAAAATGVWNPENAHE